MITSRSEFEEWLQFRTRRYSPFEQEEITNSVELKLALVVSDFRHAEIIVSEILDGKTDRESQVKRIVRDLVG